MPSASREVYHSTGMGRPRVMLTIHNMDNGGECRQDEFAFAGTPPSDLIPNILPQKNKA